MKIVVLNNQTLLDIAIQEYGTIESVFELAIANDLSITDELATGTILLIPEFSTLTNEPIITNKEILNYYKKNKIKPATAMPMMVKLNDIEPIIIIGSDNGNAGIGLNLL